MKRYIIFVLVAPFIGGLLLLLAMTFSSGYWDQINWSEVGTFISAVFSTLLYSYLFGLLPSLLIAAVDDMLSHILHIKAIVRMILVGMVGFLFTAFWYGSRGSDSGSLQFFLYGLVGLVPAALSC